MKHGDLLDREIYRRVDDFLRERMRPDNPVKVAQREQSKVVLRAYYAKKEKK